MIFAPIDSQLLFSRNDSQDPRLGDKAIRLPSFNSPVVFGEHLKNTLNAFHARHYILAGYPDDEGIRINGGRLGASKAPDAVRKPLYKMTPSLLANPDEDFRILDLGNLSDMSISKFDIAGRHDTVTEFALAALNENARWVSVGGGHDYGFPDAEAYIRWCKAQTNSTRPLVINFDAHLDVRPTDRGISSGTPFFRMLEKNPDVDFAEIGIQSQCNSRSHLEWVKSRGARVLMQEEVEASGVPFIQNVIRLLGDWILKPRPVFLSIDIDAFSSSVAPGCSQSWATGMTPEAFFPALELLRTRLDVRLLGIYEVSPPLDQDDRTAKLAGQIIHRVIT